jgi:hypothetical protein
LAIIWSSAGSSGPRLADVAGHREQYRTCGSTGFLVGGQCRQGDRRGQQRGTEAKELAFLHE